MGTLFLVSTPIGNLGDLSRRASQTLGSVSRILAEDTRHTRKLLSHLGLSTPLVSLHAHNEASREGAVLEWLEGGEELALVSDAGTPLVSDPGARLVAAVLDAGHRVVPIPGPSAVLAALAGSGLPTDRFTFLGFLPRKGRAREGFLGRIAAAPDTVVLFESPERTQALLQALLERCGRGRRGVVAREITKLHEEFIRGSLEEILDHVRANPPRGEITLVLEAAPCAPGGEEADEEAALALSQTLLEEGLAPSQVAREVARRLRLPRNQAYRLVQSRSPEEGKGS